MKDTSVDFANLCTDTMNDFDVVIAKMNKFIESVGNSKDISKSNKKVLVSYADEVISTIKAINDKLGHIGKVSGNKKSTSK